MTLKSLLWAISLVTLGSTTALTAPTIQAQVTQAQVTQAQVTQAPVTQGQLSQPRPLTPGLNRVTFPSAGETLVGNLYLPASYQPGTKLPTILISGSWTTVKEQMAGAYAQKLADRGYAALAFDSRSFGESSGKLRNFEAPKAKVADLKNAISFLHNLDAVDRDRIAGLGICAGAGYITTLAAEDARLKAVITVAPWLHNPTIVNQVYGGEAKVQQLIQTGQKALAKFAKTGQGDYVPATSKTDKTAVMFGEIDYYQNPQRGAIPQWDNRFALATWAEWLTFNPLAQAQQVKVPTLFIHSEKAAIPDGAKQFFAAIPTQNKRFVWLNDYQQFDFYDQASAMNQSIALITEHLQSAF